MTVEDTTQFHPGNSQIQPSARRTIANGSLNHGETEAPRAEQGMQDERKGWNSLREGNEEKYWVGEKAGTLERVGLSMRRHQTGCPGDQITEL
jgi:hypothetical protein